MKALSPKLRISATTLIAFVLGSALTAPSLAAGYPASISKPKVNEQILAPVAPIKKVDSVIVPTATAATIPVIVTAAKVRAFEETRKVRPIKDSVVPRLLATSVVLGGILSGEISKAPVASLNIDKSAEIQVASDVPVRLEITGLKKSITATIFIVASDGKVTRLGTTKTDSLGNFVLPPITITKSGVTYTVRVVQSGKTSEYLVRSVA